MIGRDNTSVDTAKVPDPDNGVCTRREDRMKQPSDVELDQKDEAEEVMQTTLDLSEVHVDATMQLDDSEKGQDLKEEGVQGSILWRMKKGFSRLTDKPSHTKIDVEGVVKEMDDEIEKWMLTTEESSSQKDNNMLGATIIVPSEHSSLQNSSEHSEKCSSKNASPALSLRPSMLSSSILDDDREETVDSDLLPLQNNDDDTILGSTTDSMIIDDRLDSLLNVDDGDDDLQVSTTCKAAPNNSEGPEKEADVHLDASNLVIKDENKRRDVNKCEGPDQTSNDRSLTKEGHWGPSFETVGKNLFLSDMSDRRGEESASNASEAAYVKGIEKSPPSNVMNQAQKKKKYDNVRRNFYMCIFSFVLFALLLVVFYIGSKNVDVSRDSREPTPPELRPIEANRADNIYFGDDAIANDTELVNILTGASDIKFPPMYVSKSSFGIADEQQSSEEVATDVHTHGSHQKSKFIVIPKPQFLEEFAPRFQRFVFAFKEFKDNIRRIFHALCFCLVAFIVTRWANTFVAKLSSFQNEKGANRNKNKPQSSASQKKGGLKSPPHYMKYHNKSSVFPSMYTATVMNRKGACVEVKRSTRNIQIKTKQEVPFNL